MKLINFDESTLPCFNVSKYVLDFDSMEYDDESIIIPFKKDINNNDKFKPIKVILEDRLKDFYTDELFDDLIDDEFSLIIWNTDNGYVYKIQIVTDNAYTNLEIEINYSEYLILKSVIDKAFKCPYDIDNARIDVMKTFAGKIPRQVLNQLKLVTDTLEDNKYHSAWITNDCTSSVFANINDVSKPDCPVEIVKFAC